MLLLPSLLSLLSPFYRSGNRYGKRRELAQCHVASNPRSWDLGIQAEPRACPLPQKGPARPQPLRCLSNSDWGLSVLLIFTVPSHPEILFYTKITSFPHTAKMEDLKKVKYHVHSYRGVKLQGWNSSLGTAPESPHTTPSPATHGANMSLTMDVPHTQPPRSPWLWPGDLGCCHTSGSRALHTQLLLAPGLAQLPLNWVNFGRVHNSSWFLILSPKNGNDRSTAGLYWGLKGVAHAESSDMCLMCREHSHRPPWDCVSPSVPHLHQVTERAPFPASAKQDGIHILYPTSSVLARLKTCCQKGFPGP